MVNDVIDAMGNYFADAMDDRNTCGIELKIQAVCQFYQAMGVKNKDVSANFTNFQIIYTMTS